MDEQARIDEIEAGIDTTPQPWYEHARIADQTIDRLAEGLKDPELDDDEWLEFLDAKAEYHSRKANLGWLISQAETKPNPAEKVAKTGRNPDVSAPSYDRRDPRNTRRGGRR